jgi:hypothetical protein
MGDFYSAKIVIDYSHPNILISLAYNPDSPIVNVYRVGGEQNHATLVSEPQGPLIDTQAMVLPGCHTHSAPFASREWTHTARITTCMYLDEFIIEWLTLMWPCAALTTGTPTLVPVVFSSTGAESD